MIAGLVGAAATVRAQSTNSEYPTPITSNEISGTIRARDVGDARLTTYYYIFNGTQGDVFLNVTANNFNGDIDVFAADGLRPLSKIKIYADASPTETGRIIYLRQPLKLILRIEGRTPDDNPAAFTIKFAGSFAALPADAEQPEPSAAKVEVEEQSAVKVNSVGTIIEERKAEQPKEKAGETGTDETARTERNAGNRRPKNKPSTKPEIVVTDDSPTASDNEDRSLKIEDNAKEPVRSKEPVVRNKKNTRRKTPPAAVPKTSAETSAGETETPPADPLANVHLIVLMKNGDRIEYSMTEVFRFSLNNNVLTVILKNGQIERRSLLDIQRFSVE